VPRLGLVLVDPRTTRGGVGLGRWIARYGHQFAKCTGASIPGGQEGVLIEYREVLVEKQEVLVVPRGLLMIVANDIFARVRGRYNCIDRRWTYLFVRCACRPEIPSWYSTLGKISIVNARSLDNTKTYRE